MLVAKLPGSTYSTAAMNAGPRNGSTARTPRLSPDRTRSAASVRRVSPGSAPSETTTCRASGTVSANGKPEVSQLQARDQPTDGPSPSDWGVLESGDGWCRPSSSEPNSVIRAALPPQGVCSSATSVLVVSSRPATDAPFCGAERTT